MKIAIYDIIHLEQVLPLVSVCRHLSVKLMLFTNDRFREEIQEKMESDNPLLDVVYFKSEVSEWRFIKLVKEKLRNEKFDLFLLNSTDGKHLIWYSILKNTPGCKFVFNIHEVHNFFYSRFHFGLRSVLRHSGKKLLLKRADAFIVNTEAMKLYMEQKKVTALPIFWIPAVVFERNELAQRKEHLKFTITIPGTIDERRRDYHFVLAVYELLLSRMNNTPQLIFAGAPYGSYGIEIIEKAATLNIKGADIIYFKDELPEKDFTAILNASDLLWSPLKIATSIFDGIKEVYGQTKNSGNTHDAVRFAKPMLIHKELNTTKEIESSILRYDSVKSCSEIIADLAADQSRLTQLKTLATQNAIAFTIDKVSAKFQAMLSRVISARE